MCHYISVSLNDKQEPSMALFSESPVWERSVERFWQSQFTKTSHKFLSLMLCICKSSYALETLSAFILYV